jgi:hypothetical protein
MTGDDRRGAAALDTGRAPGLRPAALALSALLTACAEMAAGGGASFEQISAAMPREISGFVLGDSGRQQERTLSFDYATSNRAAVATVLVYDTGGRAAPTDPRAAEIERELSAAVAEVTDAPYGRTGRRLSERERITIADPGLRCAILEGSFGRAPVTRHLCVGGAQGRFVKVQVTMATRPTPSADAGGFAAGALRAVRGR